MSVSEVEQAIIRRITEGVHQRLAQAGENASRLDPDRIAAAMLNAMPTEHPFERLGPFYDTAGLVAWLRVSRQALHQRVKARQVLAPPTSGGQRVYPAWQFTPDGTTLPGLAAVLRVLLASTDEWTAAIWLTTPADRLRGESAISLLTHTRAISEHVEPLAAILSAARDDAARWAQ